VSECVCVFFFFFCINIYNKIVMFVIFHQATIGADSRDATEAVRGMVVKAIKAAKSRTAVVSAKMDRSVLNPISSSGNNMSLLYHVSKLADWTVGPLVLTTRNSRGELSTVNVHISRNNPIMTSSFIIQSLIMREQPKIVEPYTVLALFMAHCRWLTLKFPLTAFPLHLQCCLPVGRAIKLYTHSFAVSVNPTLFSLWLCPFEH
jgi:hypothetical protein